MARYVVRIRKTELVMLAADVIVAARTATAARRKVIRHLASGGEIDDRLWFERDSSYTDNPVEIEGVWLDPDG